MQVHHVEEEILEVGLVHHLHIVILVQPCERLFTNRSVYAVYFQFLLEGPGVISEMTALITMVLEVETIHSFLQ